MTLDVEALEALGALAARLAREAGTMVREGRSRGVAHVTTKSTTTDMVTEFDRASEALIVGHLREVRPDDAIVGEEGTDTPGRSGIRWLIDPIDGTTNFLYGLPCYNVSVAARTDDGTQVGAVYVPSTDELFTAIRGQGAFLNRSPIRCSTTSSLEHALVGTGFSYMPARREQQARQLARLLHRVRDIRRFGAAATDLCYTAAGRFDAYFEEGLGPWDLAAGELIAREAGCRSGSYDGGPARPGSVVVANPHLFDQVIDLLMSTTDGGAEELPPGIM